MDENLSVTQSAKLFVHPYSYLPSSDKSISVPSNSSSSVLRTSPIPSGTANTGLILSPIAILNICMYELETGTGVRSSVKCKQSMLQIKNASDSVLVAFYYRISKNNVNCGIEDVAVVPSFFPFILSKLNSCCPGSILFINVVSPFPYYCSSATIQQNKEEKN